MHEMERWMNGPGSHGEAKVPARRWREVAARLRNEERARVVPLPLALVAVALPFLVAWASAELPGAPRRAVPELPEPLQALGRDTRVAETPGVYVDVWGKPEPWEASWLERRGYVRAK